MTELEFGGERRSVAASVVDTVVSPLTGKTMREFTVEFRAAASEGQALRDAFGDAEEIVLVLGEERVACERGNWSTSERQGGGVLDFTARLDEQDDEIRPDSVAFAGHTLVPLSYEEELTAYGRRDIVLTAEVSEKEAREMWELFVGDRETLSVVRVGVSDEALDLEPGVFIHGKAADGVVRVRFALVGPEKDPKPVNILGLLPALLVNATRLLTAERGRSEALLDLLRDKGVLTGEEVAAIRERTGKDVPDARYGLSEVEDVDGNWF